MLFCIIEFLIEKGEEQTLLTKNSSYAYARGITSDLKGFTKVRVPKKKNGGHFRFDVNKGFGSNQGPGKLTFL